MTEHCFGRAPYDMALRNVDPIRDTDPALLGFLRLLDEVEQFGRRMIPLVRELERQQLPGHAQARASAAALAPQTPRRSDLPRRAAPSTARLAECSQGEAGRSARRKKAACAAVEFEVI